MNCRPMTELPRFARQFVHTRCGAPLGVGTSGLAREVPLSSGRWGTMWPVDAPEPVVIGSDTEGLTIRIVSRMHPGADDYWDGNWLVSPVEVRVGGFTGRVAAGLRAEELARLREGLEALYASLEGEARLESLEDWVTLTCRGDGKGHVDVRGGDHVRGVRRTGSCASLCPGAS